MNPEKDSRDHSQTILATAAKIVDDTEFWVIHRVPEISMSLHPLKLHGLIRLLLISFVATTVVRGDEPAQGRSSQLETVKQISQQEEASIAAEIAELRVAHYDANAEQWRAALTLWEKRNAERLSAQQARAVQLQNDLPQENLPAAPLIPESASPAVRELLTEQFALVMEFKQLQARDKDASPEDRRAAFLAWQEQNQNKIGAEQTLSTTSAVPERQISEPVIAADASPAVRRFLNEEFALHLEFHRAVDAQEGPEARRDAMIGWLTQNEDRLAAQQKLAAEIEVKQPQ